MGSKLVYEGPIFSVREETFRYDDGSTSNRQVAVHPGAVAIIAHDERTLYMVRQPREAVREEGLLEIPAGKLDLEGESPLDAAKRELAEEVGKQAREWRQLKRFYPSPGFASEEMHLLRATGLSDVRRPAVAEERIEVVPVPLAELDEAIERCVDGKSLVGLLILRQELGHR